MPVIVIQHPVANFEAWRKAFDSDPMGRAKSGVTRHAIFRAADDPNHVVVHLKFATLEEAERFMPKLRETWKNVGDKLGLAGGAGPQARILNEVERVEY